MTTSVSDIKTTYPVLAYHFSVSILGMNDTIAFSDVSGLELGYETITYKDGMGVKYMPGMPEPVKLTLKRGLVKGNSMLYNWINSVRLNRVEKRNIIINLLDENANPLITWTIKNTFPTKLTAPTFDGKSNEVAIESLELMADSFTMENKK